MMEWKLPGTRRGTVGWLQGQPLVVVVGVGGGGGGGGEMVSAAEEEK